MGRIDFDAQRAEAGVESHSITVAGREVGLCPILSLRFTKAMSEGDIARAVEEMVEDPADAGHLLDNLGIDDLNQIAEDIYGMVDEEGESPNREARRRAKRKSGKG